MEGAKKEDDKRSIETNEKINDENEINKKEKDKDILPSEINKQELKENKENMIIEKEKVLNEMDNKNNSEELEKEKSKQETINKEIYRTRLTSIKETSCRSINNYKIIEGHIGEGTFGMVFKAEYVGDPIYAEKNRIPKKVALKKIKMEDSKEGFPITALREIMLMKKCHHENILEI